MSLSKEPAYSNLKSHFVCGYRNIMGEPYAGNSGIHTTRGNAVDTTNGAGGHNIQLFVMNADGVVLHCLTGYWNPQDLSEELRLALKINDLYNNKSLSQAEKIAQYKRMQLDHVRSHSPEMVARSELQGFDMHHEARNPNSDFIKDRSYIASGQWERDSHLAFRTTDEVLHKRMAERPFLSYGQFDVARFCDYGTHTYDKHEDNLDSAGRMVESPAPFVPIKNSKTMAAFQQPQRRAVSGAANKVYVKTYGSLRKACAANASYETAKASARF